MLLVEHVLQFDIAARDRIAHDHQIGRGCRLASLKGCDDGMPSDARKSDIGGYAALSEPVT